MLIDDFSKLAILKTVEKDCNLSLPLNFDEFINLNFAVFQAFSKNDLMQGVALVKQLTNFLKSDSFLLRLKVIINSLKNHDQIKKQALDYLSLLENNNGLLAIFRNEQLAGNLVECSLHVLENTLNNCQEIANSSLLNSLENQFKLTPKELVQIAYRKDELFDNDAIFSTNAMKFLIDNTSKKITKEQFKSIVWLIFTNKKISLLHLPSILQTVSALANTEELHEFCSQLEHSDWQKITEVSVPLLDKVHRKKYPERPLEDVYTAFKEVKYPLPQAEIDELFTQYKKIAHFSHELAVLDGKALKERLSECQKKLKEDPQNKETQAEILAIIREVCKQTFGIFPFNVQIINILALMNDPDGKRIAQIKTGEGKSTIIAILAAYEALTSGNKVDIITTVYDLAERDTKKYKPFFEALGLSCESITEAGQYDKVNADIIYTTAHQLEFIYLTEKTTDRLLRMRKCAIVDEIDNMFIDRQNSGAYLSTDYSEGENLTKLYTLIWMIYTQAMANRQNIPIEKTLPFIRNKIKTTLPSLDNIVSDEKISSLLQIAAEANRYQDGREYFFDKTNKKINIVEYEHTGLVENESMRWRDGLHCFIELKHKIKPQPERLTFVSTNHIDYFNRYSKIYGVTGTVGNELERQELHDTYGCSTYDAPPYFPRINEPFPNEVIEPFDEDDD